MSVCNVASAGHSNTGTAEGSCDRRKEGNVLFNNALNTFVLRLYEVGHMVKDHSDSERRNPLPPHGYYFSLAARVRL